jgi:hypothetical protein
MKSHHPSNHSPTLPFWIEVYKIPKKWVLIRRTEKEVLSPSDIIAVSGPFQTAEEAHQWARENIPDEFQLCPNNKQILTKNDRFKLASVFEENQDNFEKNDKNQDLLVKDSSRSVSGPTIPALMLPAGLFIVCILGLIGYVGIRINDRSIKAPQASSSMHAGPLDAVANGELSFSVEASRAANILPCDESKTISASDGLGEMYSCISGAAQTVKFYINEDPATGSVKNIKLIWNDWFKDVGYGVHADYVFAISMLDAVLTLYPTQDASQIKQVFLANQNRTFWTDQFGLVYTYQRGPAIDERMLVITPKYTIKKTAQSVAMAKQDFETCREKVAKFIGYTELNGDGEPVQEDGYISFMLMGKNKDIFFCEIHSNRSYKIKAALNGQLPFRYVSEGNI